MADIVLVNPRFEVSYWGLEHALPLMGKRATLPVACLPLLAALTAVNIIFSGWRLLRESVGGLMDEAVPPATMERIRRIVAEQASGAIEAHDLRSRHAGRHTFLEFHLVVPGDMRVSESHEICDRIEAALKAELEDAIITIHVEPEAKAKQQGVPVL